MKIAEPCLCDWHLWPHSAPVRVATEECRIHSIEAREPTIAEVIRAVALEEPDAGL